MQSQSQPDASEDTDIVISSMWPENVNEGQSSFETPGSDHDVLDEVNVSNEPMIVDFQRLMELTNYMDKGNSQLANLVKNWEHKQENAVRLLKEEIDSLNKQKQEAELKKLDIQEEHRFEKNVNGDNKRPVSVLDEKFEIDAEYGSILYWKQRALHSEKLLEASLKREQVLVEKLQESIENLEKQPTPVEGLAQVLKRADNFLHFILQNAPVIMGHQDKELRYRFIFNHFPSLRDEDIIGKTDVEIFTGSGVQESQDFKREVLERGMPAKREITFASELFGSKTFLIYVEPVFSKAGETIGVNYMGMEITDQLRKREKMAKLREEIAVQKAKEMELIKTVHIQEVTMQAKQMFATMSQEIKSPLRVVINMAQILDTTKLDGEQKQLLKIMLLSGDLVLRQINDLDHSEVESGVTRLEASKFRPREVVKHVLQTAAASLHKSLTLEGHVADDVPIEVLGDVLNLLQVLSNLIRNAIKFTHEGEVGVMLHVVPKPQNVLLEVSEKLSSNLSTFSAESRKESFAAQNVDQNAVYENTLDHVPISPTKSRDEMLNKESKESARWIVWDVYYTGMRIPEDPITTLFEKNMPDGADTSAGTGSNLSICKHLVELMGGQLSVSSVKNQGSTFTFLLPYKVPPFSDSSDMENQSASEDGNDNDLHRSTFVFKPHTSDSSISSQSSEGIQKL